jgi:hypothetical protein
VVPSSSCSYDPALLEANDHKGDDSADNKKPDNRHCPVEVSPPTSALVTGLVDNAGRVPEFGLAAVPPFRHIEFGVGRERKHAGDHPSLTPRQHICRSTGREDKLTKREQEPDDEQHNLSIALPENARIGGPADARGIPNAVPAGTAVLSKMGGPDA